MGLRTSSLEAMVSVSSKVTTNKKRRTCPLVSILIPTYNRPALFEQALKSAVNQTYTNLEIIVCDNSDNDETAQIVKAYKAMPHGSIIRYYKNKQNKGPIANQHQCLAYAKGKYINYLMDDDLFHPEKIEIMLPYLLKHKEVSLVTSRRKAIDEQGRYVKTLPESVPFLEGGQKRAVIQGKTLIARMLHDRYNYIGEPTTVLFRKSALTEPFGKFLGQQANNNVDVASWLTLLAKKNAVYLATPLSSFRKHATQLSRSTGSRMALLCDWIDHTVAARRHGLFAQDEAYLQAINNLRRTVEKRFARWNQETDGMYRKELIKRVKLLAAECSKYRKLGYSANQLKFILAELEAQNQEPNKLPLAD